jgi:hypothetical protein
VAGGAAAGTTFRYLGARCDRTRRGMIRSILQAPDPDNQLTVNLRIAVFDAGA